MRRRHGSDVRLSWGYWAIVANVGLLAFGQVRICAAADAPGPYTLTIVAKKHKSGEGMDFVSNTGHAFMIIGTRTNTGVKEEAYGFYPNANSKYGGLISTKGTLENEFGPTAPATLIGNDIAASVSHPITERQLRDLRVLIDSFNGQNGTKPYVLGLSDCVGFVRRAAMIAGWDTPINVMHPATFVGLLAQRNPPKIAHYAAQIDDVDDRAQIILNGVVVKQATYPGSTGRVELPTNSGSNVLELKLINEVPNSPVSWRVRVWNGNTLILKEDCAPCFGGVNQTVGVKITRRLDLPGTL